MTTWQERVDAVWADADRLGDQGVLDAIDALAAEAPDPALALFERGGARDSAGLETEAEPLYRAALAAGLPDDERALCTIQLASTLRNLGRAEEGLTLLSTIAPDHPYAGAAACFRALALVSLGRPVDGVSELLHALAPTLPRYQRSVRAYADTLVE
ncbi:MAG TPA: tetratricopeptide repeat protein [Pseudolysinimonas sp.]|nr:tetratricopeptide repeat protein [Pseudolysinimonas sp.]